MRTLRATRNQHALTCTSAHNTHSARARNAHAHAQGALSSRARFAHSARATALRTRNMHLCTFVTRTQHAHAQHTLARNAHLCKACVQCVWKCEHAHSGPAHP
eukprot:5390332-Pleurochrysis_carterae.AAC.1